MSCPTSPPPARSAARALIRENSPLIIGDSLAIVLSKGHVAPAEATEILALVAASGSGRSDVERIAGPLAKHFAVLDDRE